MKIKLLEFENFRNFKKHGKIVFDTMGKINVIYGDNGDGKTTLHQLFHWMFYNNVNFNKTASDKMYNLELEKEACYDDQFSVIGMIEFDHNGQSYLMRREWIYKKGVGESRKVGENFNINRRNESNDWVRLSRPELFVEELLPSGLSQYFFFDGESMIADLRVKGRDSASKLKKALYSMFDLKIYEQAKDDIGKTNSPTTVLGSLYLSKVDVTSSETSKQLKIKVEQLESKLQELEQARKSVEDEKIKHAETINSLSEKIGNTKTKQEYERQRAELKKKRDFYLSKIQDSQAEFGEEVSQNIPKLLLLKRIESARSTLKMKIDQTKLLPGVNKELIDMLLAEEKCICGTTITQKEKINLQELLKLLPPLSHKDSYDRFSRAARTWGQGYSLGKLEKPIQDILQFHDDSRDCDRRIDEIDNRLKESKDIQDLIIDRKKAEECIRELDIKLREIDEQSIKVKAVLKKNMNDYDKAADGENTSKIINEKIEIMEAVKGHFVDLLENSTIEYSEKLKTEIQSLLDKMMTSKRRVSVTTDFEVSVVDSYNDESKSEGQFAIVSFAYIAGILKLLQSQDALSCKEYPLVLDGPFSKLTVEHRQNVINTIPEYAPQIILFSKDDLRDCIAEDKMGSVCTIMSNLEKNVAEVAEGYLWK